MARWKAAHAFPSRRATFLRLLFLPCMDYAATRLRRRGRYCLQKNKPSLHLLLRAYAPRRRTFHHCLRANTWAPCSDFPAF